MPPALVAALPIILGGIGAATAVGGTIYGIENQPSGKPGPPNVPAAIQAETQSRAQAAQGAAQELPGLQASTSGGVSPGYLEQMSALESGNGNLLGTPQLQQAIQSFLGIGGGSATSGGTGPPGAGSVPGLMLGGSANPAITSAANSFMNPDQGGLSVNPFAAPAFA